jgi:Tol biopolymer transport system component
MTSSAMCRIGWLGVLLALALMSPAGAEQPVSDTPWWEQHKICYFWQPWLLWDRLGGTYPHLDTAAGDTAPVSNEDLIKELAGAGATVFVDRQNWTFHTDIKVQTPGYKEDYYGQTRPALLNRASLARKYGLRYFSHRHYNNMTAVAEKMGARLAVNSKGLTPKEWPAARGGYAPCPLDEKAVEEWLFKYALDMARSGVVDGCQLDYEMVVSGFSGLGDQLCYCDDCFGKYAEQNGITEQVARADRYDWLREKGTLRHYLTNLRDRLTAVYRRGAERVRAVKPDFIFGAYPGFVPGDLENSWRFEGLALGLHSPEAPFFVVDQKHYEMNHTAPWWDTGNDRVRDLGMKLILGSWAGGILGGQPEMDVSAAQWIYDAAITHDGYWMWTSRKWGPQDYAIHRTANRRIRATEGKVGDFLFKGTQDATFVTAVEQSGDPALGRNVVARTYHLGKRHLVRVNNVNTDRSVSVLIRFPRLEPDGAWTVSDAMTDLHYAHGLGEAIWNGQDLKQGVLLTMEKRSEAWLRLDPQTGSMRMDRLRMVAADVIIGHPNRPATARSLPVDKPVSGDFPLMFLRNGPIGYQGHTQPVLGTSIFLVDAGSGSDAEDRHVFAIKGDCWSPSLSPDRRQVVFAAYVNGRGQIYTVNATATALTGGPGMETVTKPYWENGIGSGGFGGTFVFKTDGVNISDNDFCDRAPVWSPDGKRVAFVSDRDGDWEIYGMNADGSDQHRLTRSPGIDRAPAWSPDGSRIAFESDRRGDFDIHVMDADGADERVLVDRTGNDLAPCWSPGGDKIACTVQGGSRRELLAVDTQTGVPERGAVVARPYKHISDICWSPDGQWIAGTFEGHLSAVGSGCFVVGADGADLNELVAVPPLKPHPGGELRGHQLVGGWYLNGDASDPFLLRTFSDLSWSPDGQTIAFRSNMDPSGYDFFYTIPVEGGEATRLDNTLSPMGIKNEPVPLNPDGESKEPWETVPAQKLPTGTELLVDAPEFWMFRTDPNKIGETEKWFAPSPKRSPWSAISTHDFWDKALGTEKEPHYVGVGWYAVDLIIPPAQGKKVWMHFGAIDENYTLWINGKYIGDNLAAGTSMWDQPVSVEITDKYNEGQSNHVVLRVRNTLSAGGIWKPVALLMAAPTFYEGFDYPVGAISLTGQGGWLAHPVGHASFNVPAGGFAYTDGNGRALVTTGNKTDGGPARSGNLRPLNAATRGLFGQTQTIYASVLWQNLGGLALTGTGSGSLSISAGSNAASAAIRASLGDIDGSASELVYGPSLPYGTPTFLGIKIDNIAGGAETVTVVENPDLREPDWSSEGAWSVTGKDIGIPNMVEIGTMGDKLERAGHALGIDEIRIGATWADVAPIVPKPATLATPVAESEFR